MDLVAAYPGSRIFRRGKRCRPRVFIVSHKTRHRYWDRKHDLQQRAGFLAARGLGGDDASQISPARVFFD